LIQQRHCRLTYSNGLDAESDCRGRLQLIEQRHRRLVEIQQVGWDSGLLRDEVISRNKNVQQRGMACINSGVDVCTNSIPNAESRLGIGDPIKTAAGCWMYP
jgi:hypothetical protein